MICMPTMIVVVNWHPQYSKASSENDGVVSMDDVYRVVWKFSYSVDRMGGG